jgi:hypothetical protein
MRTARRVLLLLSLLAALGHAEEAAPRDTRDTWTVAFSALSAQGISTENSYLASSAVLLIRDRIARLPSHAFSDEERAFRRAAVLSRELSTLAGSIAQIRKERDEAFFNAAPAATQSGNGEPSSVESRLAAALARRSYLESLDPSAVEVPAEKPIALKDGPGAGKLFDPPPYSPGEFCERQELDMAVGGTIREVQSYILLDIWAYDAARGRVVFRWREAGGREELYVSLQGAASGLTEAILGRPWAALSLAPDPAEASVIVDGSLASSGGPREIFLLPGAHEIRASAAGYLDLARTVDLAPGSETSLPLVLEPTARETVALATDPPGADVYVDSLWKGKTPLDLELPATRSRVLLAKPGFNVLPFSLGPGAPVRSPLTLETNAVSREQRQKKAREDFYGAFGWFLISLPAPLFCYRYAFDYAGKAQALVDAGRITEAIKAIDTGNILYWSSVGGAALSASLFVWVATTIVRYITASDRAAG